MEMTFIQVYESKSDALKAAGFLQANGYKIYLVDGTDMADVRGSRKDGTKSSFTVGEIDDEKVYVVLATKDAVVES